MGRLASVRSGVDLRIILILLAVLAAVVIALLFAAPVLVDVTRYRSDIEAVASGAAGQPVQINGALAFRVLPTPRLVVEDVHVAPPSRYSELKPLLKAERAVILLSSAELMSGRFTADRVVIERPEISLHTDLAGHSNLIVNRGKAFPVRNLTLEGGTFSYLNERRGRSFAVVGLDGQFSTEGAFDTRTIDISGTWDGRKTQLSGRLTSSDRPSVSAELQVDGVGRATIKGRMPAPDSWSINGEIAVSATNLLDLFPASAIQGLPVGGLPVLATGQAEITTESVSIIGIAGDMAGAAFGGRLSIQLLETPKVDVSMSFEQLDGLPLLPWVQDVADRAVAGEFDRPKLAGIDVGMQFDAGLVAFPGGFIRQLSASANYQGGTLKVDRLAALLPGGSDFAFSGDVRLAGGAFRVSGNTELGSDNLTALLEAASAPVKSGGHGRFRNFSMSAGLLIDSSVAQISSLDLRFDQSRVTGGVAIALLSRPSFSANLTVDQLNANAYAGLFDFDAAGLTVLQGDPTRPAMPLLGAFDTNAELRIGRLIAGGSVARGVKIEAGLLGGVLDLNALEIDDLDGGTFRLSGRMDTPENPQWLLRGTLASANPARMFGGAVGDHFPVLLRTGELTADFGLEGGPARTAADIELSMPSMDVRLEGLVSRLLSDIEFDLDADLSAPQGQAALLELFPGLSFARLVNGPLLAQGRVAGRTDDIAVEGKIDVLAARAEVQGQVIGLAGTKPSYDLQVRVRHGDFIELLNALGSGVPVLEIDPAPVDASFQMMGGQGHATFSDLRFQAGADVLEGHARIDWQSGRPVFEASIDSGSLDLDRYADDGTYGASAAVTADDRAYRWSKLPLDWRWMRSLDIRASVRLDGLVLLGLGLADVRFDFASDNKSWKLDRFSAALGEGRLEGEAGLQSRPTPELTLVTGVTNVALPSLLTPFLGREHEAGGNISLTLELDARGLTEHDMVRSLSGRIELGEGTSVMWPPEVQLKELSGIVAISNGVARAVPALVGVSDNGAVSVVGSADLGDWLADLEIRAAGDADGRNISIGGPMQDLRVR